MSRGLGQGARGTGGAAWTAAFGGRRACAAASGFGPHINSGRAGARPSKGAGARPSKDAGACLLVPYLVPRASCAIP
jgi:hypothetical protein